MGMCASQARYLGLTARKTNVEYEGQQINQARTALANQSANAFNDLLSLEVPTAPSTQDYTTLEYSYEDGANTETISSMTQLLNDPDGYNYLVTHYHYADVYTGIESKLTNPQVLVKDAAKTNTVSRSDITQTGSVYYKNGVEYLQYDPANPDQNAAWEKLKEENPSLGTVADADVRYLTDTDGLMHFATIADLSSTNDVKEYYIKPNTPTKVGNKELSSYNPDDSTQAAAYEQILRDWPNSAFAASDPSDIYTWESQGQRYFSCYADLMASATSAPDPAFPSENQQKLTNYCAKALSQKIETTEKARVEIDGSGRLTSIQYEDSSAVYTLSTETVTDEAAYNDAMNQYNYNVQVYEKKIADINAKTKKIQEQDRTLELRLKQLDTEQEALQTEMEAVKKVIDKNIEQTFKTFE